MKDGRAAPEAKRLAVPMAARARDAAIGTRSWFVAPC